MPPRLTAARRVSLVAEFLFVLAQLRDVLPAEDSAVMTKEHNHFRIALPERTQAHLIAPRIREHDAGETAAE